MKTHQSTSEKRSVTDDNRLEHEDKTLEVVWEEPGKKLKNAGHVRAQEARHTVLHARGDIKNGHRKVLSAGVSSVESQI